MEEIAPDFHREEQLFKVLTELSQEEGRLPAYLQAIYRRSPELIFEWAKRLPSASGPNAVNRAITLLGGSTPAPGVDAGEELQRCLRTVVGAQPARSTAMASRTPTDSLCAFGHDLPLLYSREPAPQRKQLIDALRLAVTLALRGTSPAEGELLLDANRKPLTLGAVTLVVPGLFNVPIPAGFVFRAARYTQGPVILAAANPSDGHQLRKLVSLGGVPVPPELQGKIWLIGDEELYVGCWLQASDLFLHQLEAINQAYPRLAIEPVLAEALCQGSSLRDVPVTVIGYSQGALASSFARARLEKAGETAVIDNLAALAAPLGGSPWAEWGEDRVQPQLLTWLVRNLLQLLQTDGRQVLGALDAHLVEAYREDQGLRPEHVDLAIASTLEQELHGVMGVIVRWNEGPDQRPNDSAVYPPTEEQAREVIHYSQRGDHASLVRDPGVVDLIAAWLNRDPQSLDEAAD